jgi:hypothetical protein
MKRFIPVLLVLAVAGALPGSAAAAPRYPCGELHRTVDVTRAPLCAVRRSAHPGSGPRVDLTVLARPAHALAARR